MRRWLPTHASQPTINDAFRIFSIRFHNAL
jgi:hypothetical protein